MKNKMLDLKYVNEIITDNEVKMWNNKDILIQAQTGTGKTHFVLGNSNKSGLIDKVGDCKILYVYNRKKLGREIKETLIEKYNININYTNEELDDLEEIKNITILSYQKLEYKIKKCLVEGKEFDVDEYEYIICDESHYFLTDASFNSDTEYSYELLVTGWCSFVSNRIFITATMDEVKDLFRRSCVYEPIEYTSGKDYSYLNVKYFKKNDTITTLIKNDESEDKWLIFVKSKKDGYDMRDCLSSYGIPCEFINSDTKEEYISDNKFDFKVLLATKVIDNGINLKDEEIKHIVINSYDQVTMIQEIGRVRVNIKNAREINLYLNTFSKSLFINKLNIDYNPKIEQVNLFKNNPNNFKLKYSSNHSVVDKVLFRVTDNGYKLNNLAVIRLEKDIEFANYICSKFEDDKYAYIKEQLKWLGLEETFSENNFLDNKVLDEKCVESLANLLESVIGERILDDMQKTISDTIKRDFNGIKKNIDYRTKKASVSTLNSILQNDLKLNYMISSKRTSKRVNGVPKKYVYWTVVKIED